MRRTQDAFAYVSLIVTFLGSMLFMVTFLTHDGFSDFITTFVFTVLAPNLKLLGAIGAILVVLTMYGFLRAERTV